MIPTPLTTSEEKQFVKVLESFNGKYDIQTVFKDFLEITTISLHQSVHIFVENKGDEELEQDYLYIKERYSEKDFKKMPELLGILINALGGDQKVIYQDFLGNIYMSLNSEDVRKGQFFTPYHVAKMMSKVSFNAEPIIKKGFITLGDPAIGSGVMIIAFAEEMQTQGYNSQSQLYVTGTDISRPCVYMSYIQTTLFGIPAQIIHGDTLEGSVHRVWKNFPLALNWRRFKKPVQEKPVQPSKSINEQQLAFF